MACTPTHWLICAGADAPRGQEMCDHYMAAPSHATAALACMQEIQAQCFRLGIPLRTRHREVAPNQYQSVPKSPPTAAS